MPLHLIDIAHYQPIPDYPHLAADGVFAKATEGTGFVDPNYLANHRGSRAAGKVFGAYHFARPGDPVVQADFFLAHAQLLPGDIPLLDMEDAAIGDVVGWSDAFINRVKSRVGVPAPIYLNQFFLSHYDWRPTVAIGSGLWLADYDNAETGGPSGPWPFFAFKQYSDKGVTAGEPGTTDVDAFEGTLTQLHAYGIKGTPSSPPPPPPPAPRPAVLGWNLPAGWYYGNLNGPKNCIGANYDTRTHRYLPNAFVHNIQQHLVFKGCADGIPVSAWASTPWVDGLWQKATDTAMANFHARFYGGQKYPTQCWADDYHKLVS